MPRSLLRMSALCSEFLDQLPLLLNVHENYQSVCDMFRKGSHQAQSHADASAIPLLPWIALLVDLSLHAQHFREAAEAEKKLQAAQAREAATLAAQREAEARLASAAEAEKAAQDKATAARHALEQAAEESQQAKQACCRPPALLHGAACQQPYCCMTSASSTPSCESSLTSGPGIIEP